MSDPTEYDWHATARAAAREIQRMAQGSVHPPSATADDLDKRIKAAPPSDDRDALIDDLWRHVVAADNGILIPVYFDPMDDWVSGRWRYSSDHAEKPCDSGCCKIRECKPAAYGGS